MPDGNNFMGSCKSKAQRVAEYSVFASRCLSLAACAIQEPRTPPSLSVDTIGIPESAKEDSDIQETHAMESGIVEDGYGDGQVDKVMEDALNFLLTPRKGSTGSDCLFDITDNDDERQIMTDKDIESDLENAKRLTLALDRLTANEEKASGCGKIDRDSSKCM